MAGEMGILELPLVILSNIGNVVKTMLNTQRAPNTNSLVR